MHIEKEKPYLEYLEEIDLDQLKFKSQKSCEEFYSRRTMLELRASVIQLRGGDVSFFLIFFLFLGFSQFFSELIDITMSK